MMNDPKSKHTGTTNTSILYNTGIHTLCIYTHYYPF